MLEHVLSDELEELIAAKLGNPTHDPHGDPIPTRDLTIEEGSTESLQSLEAGARGTFMRVSDSDPEMLRFLAEHGIAPGDALEVVDKQPFDGPLFVRFGDRRARARRRAGARRCGSRSAGDAAARARSREPALEGAVADGAAVALRDGVGWPRARSSELLARKGGSARTLSMLGPGVRRRRSRTSIPATSPRTPGRREVRLRAAVGRAARQPDGDAGPVPVGQARRRHRSDPARGVPRAVPAVVSCRPVGAGRGHGDGDRHRRVPGRRARAEPAVRGTAVHRRADHRRDRVRDPRAAARGATGASSSRSRRCSGSSSPASCTRRCGSAPRRTSRSAA